MGRNGSGFDRQGDAHQVMGNWEIEQANKQNKRIVGVYAQGGKDAEIPTALEKYASSLWVGTPTALWPQLMELPNEFQMRMARHAKHLTTA